MVEWWNGFIVPLVEIIILGALAGTVIFFVVKGFRNAYTKSWKFVWKYKIRKKTYPETTINWIFSCIDAEIGWYGAKKLMMVKMTDQKIVNETLWIYDQVMIELNKQKGGKKQNGRQFERGYSKEISKLPNF